MAEIWTPNSELVAVAYLPLVTTLPSSIIATSLPEANSSWAETGFVTVEAVGGARDLDLPVGRPVLTVSAWGVKGKWPLAFHLIDQIIEGFDGRVSSQSFTVKANYARARVLDGRLLTEARRVRNDPSLFARVNIDLLLNWVEVPG